MSNNIYTKYQISKSLSGDKITYLARVGKHKRLIGRASSEAELVALMAEQAKSAEEHELIAQKATDESVDTDTLGKKKKLKVLWKPGKLLQDQTFSTAAESKSSTKSNSKVNSKTSSGKVPSKIDGKVESL